MWPRLYHPQTGGNTTHLLCVCVGGLPRSPCSDRTAIRPAEEFNCQTTTCDWTKMLRFVHLRKTRLTGEGAARELLQCSL